MSIRTLMKISMASGLLLAGSLGPVPAEAAGPLAPWGKRVETDRPSLRLKSPLEIDVENNPAYTGSARAALVDQIQSDFSDFDQAGRAGGGSKGFAPLLGQTLHLERVSVEDPFDFGTASESCSAAGPCELPLDYNVGVPSVETVWSFGSASERDRYLDYIREEGARRLDVVLNGRTLRRKAVRTLPARGFEYEARYEAPSRCGGGMTYGCLVIEFRRAAWFDGGAPWPDWELRVEGSRRYPNIRGTFYSFVERAAQHTVRPKAQLKDYFTATIGRSTISERCTTCHRIDEAQEIVDLHSPGFTTVDAVFPAPSIVNDDESVNHCQNCHETDLPQDFHETRWATPTPAQDIDWSGIVNAAPSTWPQAICERIVGNLETPEARDEHFHEDARLFWAVADGVAPFGLELPTAHPGDYGLFLDRFDSWNAAGAPCPE